MGMRSAVGVLLPHQSMRWTASLLLGIIPLILKE